MSDLRQYGDFPFVGSPDDITILWQTIKEASNGTLNPPLDDVANRSHYWTLRLVEYLGGQNTPCPPCPPCPPCEPTGLQWGPDPSVLLLTTDISLDSSFLDKPEFTSFTFNDLVTIDDGGGGNGIMPSLSNTVAAWSFPDLVTAIVSEIDGTNNPSISSWSTPKLKTISGDFTLYSNPLVFLDLSSLETVGGDFDVVDDVPLTSAEYPSLISVGGYFYAANSCPNLTSVSLPALVSTGGMAILDCPLITEIDLPSYVGGSGAYLQIQNNSGLVTINLPVWVPADGDTQNFDNNALSAATVNHILARGVANPAFVSGALELSGGTNAAPTGQGIADKATLQGRGVTVNTN